MLKWLGNLVDSNEKQIKKIRSVVNVINDLSGEYEKLTDAELKSKTTEFKQRIAELTQPAREKLSEVQQALNEVRKKIDDAPDELEREEATVERKRIDEKIKAVEDDLLDAESDSLDELLPEAFAAVRESARRNLRQRHYDEQLLGGIVLHQGKIAEMRTGEGKTLVATLPVYLNALTGRCCHLVTVNDYLSKRDAQWMGAVYHALGLSVSAINGQKSQGSGGESFIYDPDFKGEGPEWERWPRMRPVTRKESYLADITYGTNNEFGFDYLRDNMVIDLSQCVQRSLNYAIVDEVDNILIDEARTPLIISGPAEDSSLKKYSIADSVARLLKGKVITDKDEQEAKYKGLDIEEGQDYLVNEKTQTVRLTDEGVQKAMHRLNISSSDEFQAEWAHSVRQAIRAYTLYNKNVQYVVKDGQVVIVDEFTGRLMFGRRYSEGLHQAIEAKETTAGEKVRVKEESRTYATITFQNYFRMYKKLAGMTGTAATEAEEFSKIYKLDVVQIPTHRPMIRIDSSDFVFKDEEAKFKAVVREVEEMHKERRPILIGTVSVEKSEKLEGMLKRRGVEPKLLNAKNHEREADIIAEAGKPGAVMVATNMAGRGVDIILGGKEPEEPKRPDTNDAEALQSWEQAHKNWEKQHSEWKARHEQVVQMGGLHVIGTERHEARRIDNQLRGRAGRQGDPGSSRFYVSLDDDVMRRFGGDRIRGIMERMGIGGEDEPIENSMVTSSIQSAQVKVEGFHFDMRKHLVEYDDVINTQREIIYGERRKILTGADLKSNILSMIKEEINKVVSVAFFEGSGDDEKLAMLAEIATIMPLPSDINKDTVLKMPRAEIEDRLAAHAETLYQAMEKAFTPEIMRKAERFVMLRVIDNLWVQHLTSMDEMRQGISLHAIAQRDPLMMYKKEGSEMFADLLANIRHDIVHMIFHINIQKQPVQQSAVKTTAQHAVPSLPHPNQSSMAKAAAASRGNAPEKAGTKKVGVNDPCPCGSGKKYKKCCGKND